MPENREKLFEQLNISTKDRYSLRQIITSLSLVVVLMVFWSLKLTGIGIAGEAFCGKQEHAHEDACFQKALICTLEETQAPTEETQPTGSTEAGHTHTDACYERVTVCELEEHIHIESCYSDITADLETYDDWEATLMDMVRGPTVKENVVLVAQSQLGYTESELNFQVDANGVRRGITRYGQWYGNPYGDWSAMFASFCLDYAGASDLPMNAGPEAMRLEWEKAELYRSAADGTPEIGNLLFLRKGEGEFQNANAVAIITGFDETTVTVIEGNLDNAVAETQYSLDDPAIMGYGLVPEPEPLLTLEEPVVYAQKCTVWLDGTDGGLGHLTGSPNTAYSTQTGAILQLPEEWTSPSKYSYKLRGWYDVTNAKYYPAGAEMEVTGNAVLYADWVAATYDIGVFNAQVADTVSTSGFITTHMFDYNYLFNVQSSNANVTVNERSHSETWSMVTSGTVKYGDAQTLNYIFAEADNGGQLSNPNNRSDRNRYHNADTISAGIYNAEMGELLYSPYNAFNPETGEGIIGKTYLGTGDHLFQLEDDPDSERYGYYYYDSLRNAISFNQSNRRFYVYDYLSATSDAIGSSYADFLPLNSPYANTNGKTVGSYNYNGVDGEYQGISHFRYDTEYSGGSYNSENNVYTEFAYGMRSDINFFLPNDPGSGGNKDLYGNAMEFEFSGDDDLWVLIDGILVLDIGGIHQRIAGEINFSTGEVTVNGRAATNLMDLGITGGDHVLTVLYLERGASMSNCSIYFNMAPRFGLELEKEDVLTQEVLNGAQFTVYEDFECSKPAELWESEDAYNQDLADGVLDQYQSTFTVKSGVAKLWGLGSGNTYYIKETGPPSKTGYDIAKGVIRVTIEKSGQATYHVDVVADAEGNEPSNGFTVHGVDIDEEIKKVYIVVTNAPNTVTETTSAQVVKKWEDDADHSGDYVQAYLTVIEPDGTVRRIREITLSDENNWIYTWTNLPKYDYDNLTEVTYGIEESYESGYYSTVRKVTEVIQENVTWAEAAQLDDGYYLLRHDTYGCLATVSETDNKLTWMSEKAAKESPLALWTVDVNDAGTAATFTNGAGQTLTYNNGNTNSNRYIHAVKGSAQNQQLGIAKVNNSFHIRLYGTRSNRSYYMTSLNSSNGRFSTSTTQNSGLQLLPIKKVVTTLTQAAGDWTYQITNTPLPSHNETSFAVRKEWVIPAGSSSTLYQEFAVTVRLLANGVNTGSTVTLTLKNNWQGMFQGLPYQDDNGNVIAYSVEEVWSQPMWTSQYGDIVTTDGSPPTYSTVITNSYYEGGPELPSTGSAARMMYVLCGSGIMLGTLVYGIGSRRKRERRMK